jgi:hypothetical protein
VSRGLRFDGVAVAGIGMVRFGMLQDRPVAHLARDAGLLALHDAVAAEHLSGEGHLALALCRPGRPEITPDDDAWADALRLTLDEWIDDTWSLHLAAGGGVVPLVGPPPFLWRSRLP